jgi:hypothetical protein
MMTKEGGSSNLILKDQVFINNQAYAQGNFIIFKGCSGLTGTGRVPSVKISGPFTPSAQKTTSEFTVEVYKSFSESSYLLSNLIVQGSGTIDGSQFTSGSLTNGVFTGLIPFIQTSATHTLQWTLQNKLPSTKNGFSSRILIKMPAQMTKDTNSSPSVKNLDGNVLLPAIVIDTEFPGCDGTIVCYSITHQNIRDVVEGSTLRFQISGTIN